MDDLWTRVQHLLQDRNFAEYATSFDRRPLIRLTNSMNGLRMRLLHWSTLAARQRILHSDENLTVDALEGIDMFGAERCEIFMVSHRWLRPRLNRNASHPDSLEDEKAHAINEFSKWRRKWVEFNHDFTPEIFYWIDFCCIDQHDTPSAIPLLPRWTACCERFLRIETPDYAERAWCRLEPLLSYAFQFADHHTIIHLGYKYSAEKFHSGQEVRMAILDPLEGKITDETDLVRIKPIVDVAKEIQIQKDRKKVEFGKSTVTCFQL